MSVSKAQRNQVMPEALRRAEAEGSRVRRGSRRGCDPWQIRAIQPQRVLIPLIGFVARNVCLAVARLRWGNPLQHDSKPLGTCRRVLYNPVVHPPTPFEIQRRHGRNEPLRCLRSPGNSRTRLRQSSDHINVEIPRRHNANCPLERVGPSSRNRRSLRPRRDRNPDAIGRRGRRSGRTAILADQPYQRDHNRSHRSDHRSSHHLPTFKPTSPLLRPRFSTLRLAHADLPGSRESNRIQNAREDSKSLKLAKRTHVKRQQRRTETAEPITRPTTSIAVTAP